MTKLRLSARLPLGVLAWLIASNLAAQTSPAHGPLPAPQAAEADMPLADYLGLLQQLSPAAEVAARTYIGAYHARCGRVLTVGELRHAMAEGGGDPVLMGLIRAVHLQDITARASLVRQVRCLESGAQP